MNINMRIKIKIKKQTLHENINTINMKTRNRQMKLKNKCKNEITMIIKNEYSLKMKRFIFRNEDESVKMNMKVKRKIKK